MKLKLNDDKFIEAAMTKATSPSWPVRVAGTDLSKLRGLVDKDNREAALDAEYEPVSFQHPETGRRVYGWLTSIMPSGEARVEIGDGEYALLAPEEIQRVGQKTERSKIQADLKRAIGQFTQDEGYRSDLRETMSPTPLGDGLDLISIGYNTSVGMPTESDLASYVSRFHPTAEICEVDTAMPGRIGVAVRTGQMFEDIAACPDCGKDTLADGEECPTCRLVLQMNDLGIRGRERQIEIQRFHEGLEPLNPELRKLQDEGVAHEAAEDDKPSAIVHRERIDGPEYPRDLHRQIDRNSLPSKPKPTKPESRKQHMAEDKEAEMDAAHGGEVQEVLDPADVVDEEKLDHGVEKTAISWPFGSTPKVDPRDPNVALALGESGQKNLIEAAIKTYFEQSGASAVASNPGVKWDRNSVLAAAMPVVARANSSLWKQISALAHDEMTQAPGPARASPPSTGRPQTRPGQPISNPAGYQPHPGSLPKGWRAPGLDSPADPKLQEALEKVRQSPESTKMSPEAQMQLAQQLLKGEGRPVAAQYVAPQTTQPASGAGTIDPKLETALSAVQQSSEGGKLAPAGQLQLAQDLMNGQNPSTLGTGVSGGQVNVGPKIGGRRAGLFERKGFEDEKYDVSGSPTLEDASPASEERVSQGEDHLLKHGLPPSMTALYNSMKMDNFARRGDYVVAKVHFDPKMMKGRTPHAIKNTVISFVKAKCGSSISGRDFGVIGRIHCLSLDKDSAWVQFASEFAGIAPTMMVSEK